ncbi:MAG: 3-methyl-2-oxobutanoate hydroxymethyltransferase, partial [Planctomycetaceae bacterium]
LTAYEFMMAEIFDQAGIDSLLVGDTMGMVVQGHHSTLPVTLDQIIYHGEIVCRAVRHALVVVDMPFMSYQVSPQQALENAGRIIKETGAGAVKLEGGANQAKTIQALADAELPVMAHVGMKPQSIRKLGGHGRVQRDFDAIRTDALAARDAGAFSIVFELIPAGMAAELTAELNIPTIGIGAGPHCDGQVLVAHDMLGLTTPDFSPKFLKRYADLRRTASEAACAYIQDVQSGAFPDDAHSHQ